LNGAIGGRLRQGFQIKFGIGWMRISYELREYAVDPQDLAAETVAAKLGFPAERVFKTLVARGDRSLSLTHPHVRPKAIREGDSLK